MAEKLGPCPLCGAKPEESYDGCAYCDNASCGMDGYFIPSEWNRLSALAASERRMREALERCKRFFGTHFGCDLEDLERICEEALKGGEG